MGVFWPDHPSPHDPRLVMSLTRTASAALVLLAACGGEAPPSDDAPETVSAASVVIVEPADGAIVEGGDVTVRLDVSNVRIVAAGDTTSGTGHHHLYLNHDLTPASEPVPTIPGAVVHMGDGSAEYVFENLPAGEHRLIAVVADGVHVPLQPWVVDTVRFTVR